MPPSCFDCFSIYNLLLVYLDESGLAQTKRGGLVRFHANLYQASLLFTFSNLVASLQRLLKSHSMPQSHSSRSLQPLLLVIDALHFIYFALLSALPVISKRMTNVDPQALNTSNIHEYTAKLSLPTEATSRHIRSKRWPIRYQHFRLGSRAGLEPRTLGEGNQRKILDS